MHCEVRFHGFDIPVALVGVDEEVEHSPVVPEVEWSVAAEGAHITFDECYALTGSLEPGFDVRQRGAGDVDHGHIAVPAVDQASHNRKEAPPTSTMLCHGAMPERSMRYNERRGVGWNQVSRSESRLG
jgi:hypothetical protein